MAPPIMKMVATTAKATEPSAWGDNDTGNYAINISSIGTVLDFGILLIDNDAYSHVKVTWVYVTDMQGNSAIANMGYFVDGLLDSTMTHYDKITSTWENPDNTGNQQQVGSVASGLKASDKHTVLRSTGASTLTAAGQHSQYIFTQYKVLSSAATGPKESAAGAGRPLLVFTYS